MKILIPNAKELHTNQDAFPSQPLSAQSQAVLKTLQEYPAENLANFYKINSSKADQEWTRWQRLADKQAKTYPAWLLYDGLMYRYMKRTQVTEAERHYLDNHLRIATALYGLISPMTLIAPHRLDFHQNLSKFSLQISANAWLKLSLWKIETESQKFIQPFLKKDVVVWSH